MYTDDVIAIKKGVNMMKNFLKWFCLFMVIDGIIVIPIQFLQGNASMELFTAGIFVIILFSFGFIKLSKNNLKQKDSNSSFSSTKSKIEITDSFNNEYLDTSLKDGKTIKQHMQEDLDESLKELQGLDTQHTIKLNDLEKQFIHELLKSLKPFNLDTEIRYNRMSSKHLNFKYRGMQIGRVKLNGRKMNIQVLHKNNDVEWHDISGVDEAIKYIDNWIEYLNYLIKP